MTLYFNNPKWEVASDEGDTVTEVMRVQGGIALRVTTRDENGRILHRQLTSWPDLSSIHCSECHNN